MLKQVGSVSTAYDLLLLVYIAFILLGYLCTWSSMRSTSSLYSEMSRSSSWRCFSVLGSDVAGRETLCYLLDQSLFMRVVDNPYARHGPRRRTLLREMLCEGLTLILHKFIYAEGANVISELALFPTFAFLFPLELSVKEHTNRPVLLTY